MIAITDMSAMVFSTSEAPGKPVGPLEATDIQRTSVTVQWKPPTDDGGSPLTGYVVEQREAKRLMWTKVATVKPDKTTCQVCFTAVMMTVMHGDGIQL